MPDTTYTRRATLYQVMAADGTILNHGWRDRDAAERDAANRGNGAYVHPHHYDAPVAPYERVLIDSGIAKEHWPLLRADMTRQLNMCRDAGRPSDAMRSSVAAFKGGTLTEESFAAARPSGRYPEDAA